MKQKRSAEAPGTCRERIKKYKNMGRKCLLNSLAVIAKIKYLNEGSLWLKVNTFSLDKTTKNKTKTTLYVLKYQSSKVLQDFDRPLSEVRYVIY